MDDSNLKLERIINKIHSKKTEWIQLPRQKKIAYLQSAQNALAQKAYEWVALSVQNKHLMDAENPQNQSQEWLTGPNIVMRQLRFLKEGLQAKGKPSLPKVTQNENGQCVAHVMPNGFFESLLWHGFQAEVWIQEGKPPTQGHLYQEKNLDVTPKMTVILGAGNVSSIAPLDAMHKLYQEGQVCIVKLNPVCQYLQPILNEVFFDLVRDGFLAFVIGDASVGSLLCHHPLVDAVHITGSHHTHDAIVWGPANDPETFQRKQENRSLLQKPITSELGCVTPAIIVPGNWSHQDLKFQAKQIASSLENNASFNCNAVKVLVTWKDWSQRDLFLTYLREELRHLPPRYAYYPGAEERYQNFLDHYPHAEILGKKQQQCVPWTLIPNLSETKTEYALENEAFCGVLAEVPLSSENLSEFLKKASLFCNEKIWGTLSCCLFVDPQTQKKNASEIQSLLACLKYGSIGVNCWSALSFALGSTTWGAYPGASLQDIQSGIGIVKNGFFLDFPEKSIVYAPFQIQPTPVWFYDRANSLSIAKSLFQYEHNRGVIPFFQLIFHALKR